MQTTIQALVLNIQNSFVSLSSVITGFALRLIVAVLVLWIGWVVALAFEKVISFFVSSLRADWYLEKAGLRTFLARGGVSLDAPAFLGAVAKWFIAFAFMVSFTQILGLAQVSAFLTQLAFVHTPNVIMAVVLLLAASVAALVLQKFVTVLAKALKVRSANFLGLIASISIWVMTALLIVSNLGISEPATTTLFQGVVAMIAIACGLAFGLGGRGEAARLLESLRKETDQ